MLWIFADAVTAVPAGLDMTALAPAISSVTSMGLATWLVWYSQTKTLPDIQKAHQDERKELQDERKGLVATHASTIDKIIDEMKQQREMFAGQRTTQSH